jgi:hypothetical protein
MVCEPVEQGNGDLIAIESGGADMQENPEETRVEAIRAAG